MLYVPRIGFGSDRDSLVLVEQTVELIDVVPQSAFGFVSTLQNGDLEVVSGRPLVNGNIFTIPGENA